MVRPFSLKEETINWYIQDVDNCEYSRYFKFVTIVPCCLCSLNIINTAFSRANRHVYIVVLSRDRDFMG